MVHVIAQYPKLGPEAETRKTLHLLKRTATNPLLAGNEKNNKILLLQWLQEQSIIVPQCIKQGRWW